MLTCQEITELVTDYLEGRLSFTERVRFRLHVGMCRHCRAYLRQMRMTVRSLGALAEEPIPEAVREELIERFRSMRPRGADAAGGASPVLRFLSALEGLGSRWGWAVVGAIIVLSLIVLAGSGLTGGPLGDGSRCLLVELGAAGVPLAVLGALTWSQRARLSAPTWVAAAMSGSLAGLALLEAKCPLAHVAPHVLTFHFGGLLLAGALGVAASWAPARR